MKFFKEIPKENNDDIKNPPFEADIEYVKDIGEGHFGEVFEVEIEKQDPISGKIRKARFALKEYREDQHLPLQSMFETERAFNNYKLLKSIGVKTFRTYRISESGDQILMSLKGTEGGWHLFDPSHSKVSNDVPLGEEIINFDKFKEDLIKNLNLLNTNKIEIGDDSIFFLVRKKDKDLEVDFLIADFDMINKNKSHSRENKSAFMAMCEGFINQIIPDKNKVRKYIIELNNLIESA